MAIPVEYSRSGRSLHRPMDRIYFPFTSIPYDTPIRDTPFSHHSLLWDIAQYIGYRIPERDRLSLLLHTEPVGPIYLVAGHSSFRINILQRYLIGRQQYIPVSLYYRFVNSGLPPTTGKFYAQGSLL